MGTVACQSAVEGEEGIGQGESTRIIGVLGLRGKNPSRNRARREDDHRIVPGDSLNTALNDDEGMRLFVVDHGSVHRDSLEETTVRLCY